MARVVGIILIVSLGINAVLSAAVPTQGERQTQADDIKEPRLPEAEKEATTALPEKYEVTSVVPPKPADELQKNREEEERKAKVELKKEERLSEEKENKTEISERNSTEARKEKLDKEVIDRRPEEANRRSNDSKSQDAVVPKHEEGTPAQNTPGKENQQTVNAKGASDLQGQDHPELVKPESKKEKEPMPKSDDKHENESSPMEKPEKVRIENPDEAQNESSAAEKKLEEKVKMQGEDKKSEKLHELPSSEHLTTIAPRKVESEKPTLEVKEEMQTTRVPESITQKKE